MIDLSPYLDLTKMMVLATKNKQGNPYTANVFFGYNPEDYTCYFISRPAREHSEHIEKNSSAAWSIVNTQLYNSRTKGKKGLQFQGTVQHIEGEEGQELYEKYYEERIDFPSFPEGHEVYACIPISVKVWDETLYAGEGEVIKF